MVTNPFIENSPVQFQGEISKDKLIKEYKRRLNIDVSEILSSTDSIKIYKCQTSDYKFYLPFDIAGNSEFYQELQEFDWYYMPWKWEHQACSELLNGTEKKILEIGCGTGDFLKLVNKSHKHIECIGLELNESSVTSQNNLKIINNRIEDYSIHNEEKFDLACCFQVLEHIPAVDSFLLSSVKCLKKKGLLVISVPNNDSFIRHDEFDILNMPPHHMGLWTEKSLKKIANQYNLDIVEVKYEPLQEYHFDWYIRIKNRKIFGKSISRYIQKLLNFSSIKKVLTKILRNRANNIHGHTIMVVFKKTTT